MGHAEAFTVPGEPDARMKFRALEDAGVTMVNHPAKFGDAMKRLLGESGRASSGGSITGASQRRSIHTISRRPRPISSRFQTAKAQKRSLYIREDLALNLLRERGINASEYSGEGKQRLLAVAVDRSSLSPCIIASPMNSGNYHDEAKYFPFDYRTGFGCDLVSDVAEYLQLSGSSRESLPKLIRGLIDIFMKKEAFLLETKFVERLGELKVTGRALDSTTLPCEVEIGKLTFTLCGGLKMKYRKRSK